MLLGFNSIRKEVIHHALDTKGLVAVDRIELSTYGL